MPTVKQTVLIFEEKSSLLLQTKVNRFLHDLDWNPLDVTFGTSYKVYEGGEKFPTYIAFIRYNKRVE